MLKAQNTNLSLEIAESRKKHDDFQNEMEDFTNKKNEIIAFAVAEGATLGRLLWKTSKTEEMIQTCIETEDGKALEDFLYISQLASEKFIQKYLDELPPATSFEMLFATSLYGILVNIAGHENGRKFILDSSSGLELVDHTLKALGIIKMPAGRSFKNILLVFLNNISISERGAIFFSVAEDGLKNLVDCFQDFDALEIQITAMKIVLNLIRDVQSPEFNQKVAKAISHEHLQEIIAKSVDEGFIKNAQKLSLKLLTFNDEMFY